MTTLSINLQETWAILIGIGEFQDSKLPNVPAVKNNLAALRKLLINQDIIGIPKEHIITLENQASLHSELVKALDLLPKRLDTLIIYYVGHGFYHGSDVYLATVDTVQTHPETGLAFADLWELTCLRATNLLYLLDCCFSGLAFESIKKRVERNISVLTATLPTNTAKAPTDKPFTAFTENLLRLLEQGCGNAPALTPQMVYEELKQRLGNQGLPKPWHNDFHTQPLFFAKNRAYKPNNINEYFKVPPSNQYFTGREAILTQLHELLDKGKVVAVCGLGGMGKTQTMVKYAYLHRAEYTVIGWMLADSRENFEASFTNLAEMLKFNIEPKLEDTIARVKQWLKSHTNWLLLLDNVDELSVVKNFVAEMKDYGKIVLSTRIKATSPIAEPLEIDKMTEAEGIAFLCQRTKQAEDEYTPKLVHLLDGLPLALDQAAAYIHEIQISFKDYFELYQTDGLALLAERGTISHDDDHSEPVTITWLLSFKKVKQQSKLSIDLLTYCAFLYADGIPEEILTSAFSKEAFQLEKLNFFGKLWFYLKFYIKRFFDRFQQRYRFTQELIREAEEKQIDYDWHFVKQEFRRRFRYTSDRIDNLQFNELIKPAFNYSLLKRDSQRKLLFMHRLVQEVLRAQLSEEEQKTIAEQVILLLAVACPDKELKNSDFMAWSKRSGEWLLNARTGEQWIKRWQLQSEAVGRLFNQMGYYLEKIGEYAQALLLFEQALQIREQVLGKQHPDYALSLNNLAGLYYSQGQYEQALPLYEQALQIIEQVLGKQHPDYAQSLNNLAALHYSQGQYEQALPLLEQALQIREQVLGKQHPDYAQSLNNLAKLYYSQGQYDKALPLFEQALQIREQVLGKQHPNTAISIWWLATYYEKMQDYKRALPLYEQAIAIFEKVLGNKHPHTKACRENYEIAKAQQNPKQTPKNINRNASCPCGSGERYKHCCGKLN